ncbi:MAG: cytoplasmic protein [Deltaproteobacteria bacterium]|nr:MAG: cytoplasmic protein [Deltaproteobacteria bacterium]
MDLFTPVGRRETIKKLLYMGGSILFANLLVDSLPSSLATKLGPENSGFIVEGIGKQKGYSVTQLVRRVFDAAGGIDHFISRGDVVAIKPNISWARSPGLAATTNPEVLRAVVELCQEAGAKKVRIVDHTIHDARRCFAITGAGRVARETGAELVFPRSSLMRKMKIGGVRLDTWPVFTPIVEADKLINIPIAKHHSLSKLTLGMKNWIGAVGGSRWVLHQDINQSIVDLARFFNPTLTLIDAIRIMTRNGPSGGKKEYVAKKDVLILSNDPVAADARAALLFGKRPADLGFIRLGKRWGLGTFDFRQLQQKKVHI